MADAIPPGLAFELKQSEPMPLGIALTISPGEVVALVGASGAGKTSTLRAIAGLMRPSAGAVRLGTETWFSSAEGINLPPQARRAGYVFQDYALFPHLSAFGNVRAACGHLDASGSRRRAAGLLDRVGLGDLATRYPAELSGGQRQRVAIARALAREPKVLLLDEPFSAVDRPVRETLKAELQALHADLGIPVLLVTHDLSEAFGLADRIAVMEQGCLLQCASASELRRQPASIAVARLVGQRNFFKGRVTRAPDGGLSLSWGGVGIAIRGDIAHGDVDWMLPSESIEIVTDTASGRDDGAVDIPGRVVKVAVAGEMATVGIAPAHRPQEVVTLALPTTFLSRYSIVTGAAATLRVMPNAAWIFSP